MQTRARIAVVGAGWWACEFHIPHVLENSGAELVSVCRVGAEELERIREHFDLPHVTGDHLEVYDRRPDGVVVASPHVLHFEHAAAALDRGCHVLVEKPMTTTTADARALVALVRDSGRTLLTPYGLNHTPYMEAAADRVRAGRIGAVRHVALHMSSALLESLRRRADAGDGATSVPPAPPRRGRTRIGPGDTGGGSSRTRSRRSSSSPISSP